MAVAEHMPLQVEPLSPDQYLLRERLADVKSEYLDGELYKMPGVSLEHDRIVRNLLYRLETKLANRSWEPFTSDMRVQLTPSRYVYPDLTVVCGEPTFTDADVDTLTNPAAIFEVLSDSTSNFDLGDKSRLYRQKSSISTLCLIAQDRPWVEVWTREDTKGWHVREFTGLDTLAELPALSLSLPLAELYRRVAFIATE